MKTEFLKEQTVTRTIKIVVSLEEFVNLLKQHKPKEIFNSHYSDKTPCWYVIEYGDHGVKFYADSAADKKPQFLYWESLYRNWIIQGLGECHFEKENPPF